MATPTTLAAVRGGAIPGPLSIAAVGAGLVYVM